MRFKCKNCGISYEGKYKVCPECGTVRFSMHFYSKVPAGVAAGFIILTLILWPLGVFDFSAAPNDESGVGYEDNEQKGGDEHFDTPGSEDTAQPDDSQDLPEEIDGLVITSERSNGYFSGEKGFTWYIVEDPLQLEVCYASGKALDGAAKPVWESSDPSVFIVDSNGKLEAVKNGNGTLTVTYGSLSESIQVDIRYSVEYSTESDAPD